MPYRDRVQLRVGRAESLPVREGEADLVLTSITSMTLQHLPDPGAAIRDIGRALVRGGVFIAVKPDNTANRSIRRRPGGRCDRFPEPISGAAARTSPGGHGIGPAVAARVERESFQVAEPSVRRWQGKEDERQGSSPEWVRSWISLASLPPGAPEVVLCRDALANGVRCGPDDHGVRLSAHPGVHLVATRLSNRADGIERGDMLGRNG